MKIQKIIIIGFVIAVIAFTFVIFLIFSNDSQEFYKSTYKVSIAEIFAVRGRPNQRTAKLSNGSTISIPSDFIPIVQVGDSLFKENNTYELILKSIRLNKVFRSTK
jgi:hypothetical protein